MSSHQRLTVLLAVVLSATAAPAADVSREQATQERTPVLHRIPLLGWLFKRDSTQDETRELLIFITPRILK